MDNFKNVDDIIGVVDEQLSEKTAEKEGECDDKT